MFNKGCDLEGLAMRSSEAVTGTRATMRACSISTGTGTTTAIPTSLSADPSSYSLDIGMPMQGSLLVDSIPQITAKARQQAKPRTAARPNGVAAERGVDLCQFFTPVWVAEALVERHFPKLDCLDTVLEPSCGIGSFLHAIPNTTHAVGVEIDPTVASIAKKETGREVIIGDFRSVEIDFVPTAVIGNPPFRVNVFDGMLARCHQLLPENGKAGFILPVYFLSQNANRVCNYGEDWSLSFELLPRVAFHSSMRTPLLFASFTKEFKRIFSGFALYHEAADLQDLPRIYKRVIESTSGSVWKTVCKTALERLGGKADLASIYHELDKGLPSKTQFWREKIRQTLRAYSKQFVAHGRGVYSIGAMA
ncbi:MAG: class I SAM-dependent methyltransferase [Methylophilaceae bacterium]